MKYILAKLKQNQHSNNASDHSHEISKPVEPLSYIAISLNYLNNLKSTCSSMVLPLLKVWKSEGDV